MTIQEEIQAGVQDSVAGNVASRYDDYPVNQEILDEVTRERTNDKYADVSKKVEDASQKSQDQSAEASKPIEDIPSKQELNFRALREEVEKIKSEKEELKRNLDLIRANQRQMEPVQEPENRLFEGLQDSDVPNVKEISQAWERREAEYVARIEELQVAQAHPDYNEVIEKFTAPLLKEKPHLVEGILGSRNKAMFAYELGKMAQASRQPPPQPDIPSRTAQKIVENSKKPATLSGAGGQGALSKADYYASMSDSEFLAMASRHLDSI